MAGFAGEDREQLKTDQLDILLAKTPRIPTMEVWNREYFAVVCPLGLNTKQRLSISFSCFWNGLPADECSNGMVGGFQEQI